MKSILAPALLIALIAFSIADAVVVDGQQSGIRRAVAVFEFSRSTKAVGVENVALTDSGLELAAGSRSGYYVSQPLEVPLQDAAPFLAVGSLLDATGSVELSLRSSVDGDLWSDWIAITPDEHAVDGAGGTAGRLLFVEAAAQFVQFRLALGRAGAGGLTRVRELRLSFISPGRTTPDKLRRSEPMADDSPKYAKPRVVSRLEWECPDGEVSPRWTPEFTTVTHLIVHHTDSPNTSSDWPAVVRSIWSYHIFDNGWSDIGYNYLIDPNGVIYEGRGGGDNVRGAHFCGFNNGTMGVAMLGNFVSQQPPEKGLESLRKLLAWKADQREIDPLGLALHPPSNRQLNRIAGHRDGCATECPGEQLYVRLQEIRRGVKDLIDPPPLPVITNAKLKGSGKLVVTGENFDLAAKVVAGDVEGKVKYVDPTYLVAKKLYLPPGTYAVRVINPGDRASAPFLMTVD